LNKIILILFSLLVFFSCKDDSANESTQELESDAFISAVDISSYPEISSLNLDFFDRESNKNDFLNILKSSGVNTVRLRLWVNPDNEHSSFDEVRQFSQTLKDNDFKVWLSLHYSDTWADPGKQIKPIQWENISASSLQDSVFEYTQKVVQEINPDYIQIGNEINTGFLHPEGHITDNYSGFLDLMKAGISAVRSESENAKIILHFAGIENSEWFYQQVSTLDYDIIGLSYYPIWHSKSLENLETKMQELSENHNKSILIAETAYPFTLEWNDWTNNIVGLEEHLILPDFSASPEGQRAFINRIISITNGLENGIGFCYWGAELVAWKGPEGTDASPWENQALFDFENKALPVLNEFKAE